MLSVSCFLLSRIWSCCQEETNFSEQSSEFRHGGPTAPFLRSTHSPNF
jgi:hypothetical protein